MAEWFKVVLRSSVTSASLEGTVPTRSSGGRHPRLAVTSVLKRHRKMLVDLCLPSRWRIGGKENAATSEASSASVWSAEGRSVLFFLLPTSNPGSFAGPGKRARICCTLKRRVHIIKARAAPTLQTWVPIAAAAAFLAMLLAIILTLPESVTCLPENESYVPAHSPSVFASVNRRSCPSTTLKQVASDKESCVQCCRVV